MYEISHNFSYPKAIAILTPIKVKGAPYLHKNHIFLMTLLLYSFSEMNSELETLEWGSDNNEMNAIRNNKCIIKTSFVSTVNYKNVFSKDDKNGHLAGTNFDLKYSNSLVVL